MSIRLPNTMKRDQRLHIGITCNIKESKQEAQTAGHAATLDAGAGFDEPASPQAIQPATPAASAEFGHPSTIQATQLSTLEADAEFDDPATIQAIQRAFEYIGHTVEIFNATPDLPQRLLQSRPDFIFNIAEGKGGRGRESHVPALLNFLGIPFSGSDETTMCVTLDKALTKRILMSYGIVTPKYARAALDPRTASRSTANPSAEPAGYTIKEGMLDTLDFPLIVKPNAEGSGMGISETSLVSNNEELQQVLAELACTYEQDILIEEYIDGREFCVGILGNGADLRVFTPMEVVFGKNTQGIYTFTVKQDFRNYVRYACPPELSAPDIDHLMATARNIYGILECRDFARLDFRLSEENELHFLEVNPLPGLAPDYSDYPILAEFNGVDYTSLIAGILDSALARYGMTNPSLNKEARK